MKALILTTLLIASSSFASSYNEVKTELGGSKWNEAVYNTEKHGLIETGTMKFGSFYNDAGASFEYTKTLNINLSEEVNITSLSAEIGTNGKDIDNTFASVEISNTLYPFFWEGYKRDAKLSDVATQGIGVVTKLKGTTFSYNTTETREKLDEFGFDTITEKIDVDKRISDFVASVGFSYYDKVFLTNSNIELTIGKGLIGNIDSESELKITLPNVNDYTFTVEGKRTVVDGEAYDSVSFGFNYKF